MSAIEYMLIAVLMMVVGGLTVRGQRDDALGLKIVVCVLYGLLWPFGMVYTLVYWATKGGRK